MQIRYDFLFITRRLMPRFANFATCLVIAAFAAAGAGATFIWKP
jgi:hypothetical protein